MKRPEYDDYDDEIEYIFQLNVYVRQLEEYVKRLRLGINYAQDVIPTDIPAFETLLQETRLEEAKTEET